MSRSEFLKHEGYRQVPPGRNGVGHFEAKGCLAGRNIRVLVDTGAASTVTSLSLARELGLEVTALGRQGGAARWSAVGDISTARRRAEVG